MARDLERFAVGVRKVEKPWGYELIWAATELYGGKLLFVRGGEELSRQYHRRKDETIYVHEGLVEVELEGQGGASERALAASGSAFRLPPGTVHRLRALEDTVLLEVSTPDLEDVVRLEDRYGRA